MDVTGRSGRWLDDDLQAAAVGRNAERFLRAAEVKPVRHQRAHVNATGGYQADRPRVDIVHPPDHRDREALAPRRGGTERDPVADRDTAEHDPPAGTGR